MGGPPTWLNARSPPNPQHRNHRGVRRFPRGRDPISRQLASRAPPPHNYCGPRGPILCQRPTSHLVRAVWGSHAPRVEEMPVLSRWTYMWARLVVAVGGPGFQNEWWVVSGQGPPRQASCLLYLQPTSLGREMGSSALWTAGGQLSLPRAHFAFFFKKRGILFKRPVWYSELILFSKYLFLKQLQGEAVFLLLSQRHKLEWSWKSSLLQLSSSFLSFI